MQEVERVAAAGEVDVLGLVAGLEAIVGPVVDAAQRQRRPVTATFGGVVVDDVEDHFDAGGVQPPNHRLELFHRAVGRRGEPHVRCEPGQRVVAPVVRQAGAYQAPLAGRLMDRQQLDGRHPEILEVADRRVRGQGRVGSAQMRRHVGMARREPLDVDLVDDRLVPRNPRWLVIVTPFEGGIENRGQRRERGAVARVRLQVALGMVHGVSIHRVVPAQGAADPLRIGIENHLGRVEAVPGARFVRAAYPVAVQLPRPDAGQIAVPDEVGPLRQRDARLFLRRVGAFEEAQLHTLGMFREDRDVNAGPVPGRAERVRLPGPEPHGTRPGSVSVRIRQVKRWSRRAFPRPLRHRRAGRSSRPTPATR